MLIGGGGERKTLRLSPSTPPSGTASATPRRSPTRTPSSTSWCATIGRDPGEIERSTAARVGPDDVGDALLEIGERLVTVSIDGRTGYDLSRVRDWVQFRDEKNAAAATTQ